MWLRILSLLLAAILLLGLLTGGTILAAWFGSATTAPPDPSPPVSQVGKEPSVQTKKPAETQLRLEAKVAVQPLAPGENIAVELVLSTSGKTYEFLLGAIPQVFGIYIAGPKGPIQPDLTKVRPENWMHQEHSAATRIRVARGQPYRVTVQLADYFAINDHQLFGPGVYKVNVKFRDSSLGMKTPIESGPVPVEIKEPPKTPQEAIAAFRSQVRTVAARTMPEARRKHLASRIATTKQLAANRQSFAAALARVTDTLTEKERETLVVYGTLADLRRAGDCWAIESSGHFKIQSEIAGYVDVNTGRLVFLWIIPEG